MASGSSAGCGALPRRGSRPASRGWLRYSAVRRRGCSNSSNGAGRPTNRSTVMSAPSRAAEEETVPQPPAVWARTSRMRAIRPLSRASSRTKAEKSVWASRPSAVAGKRPVSSPEALWQLCHPFADELEVQLLTSHRGIEHPGLAADRLLPQLEISVCASEVLDLDAEHKAVLRLLAGHGKMHLFKITCGIHSGSPSCGRGVVCRGAALRWL